MPQHGEEMTIENRITLASLPPGQVPAGSRGHRQSCEANDYADHEFHGKAGACGCPATRSLKHHRGGEGKHLSLRAIRVLGFGCFALLCALPAAAAPGANKISGVVVDPAGTPQMGATVLVSSEQLVGASPVQLLTNDRGRFSTATLPAGLYSIRVTLAGFLPAMEQHVEVNTEHATLLQIVLGSVFSTFEKRAGSRRPAG